MTNVLCFQLLNWEDLMLFFVIYDGKLDIFEF